MKSGRLSVSSNGFKVAPDLYNFLKDAQYVGFEIKSVINGSATSLSNGYGFINRTNSASTYNSVNLFASFDVTDTSTHKIRFDYDESYSQTAVLWGHTTYNGTHFTFMRLGDT